MSPFSLRYALPANLHSILLAGKGVMIRSGFPIGVFTQLFVELAASKSINSPDEGQKLWTAE